MLAVQVDSGWCWQCVVCLQAAPVHPTRMHWHHATRLYATERQCNPATGVYVLHCSDVGCITQWSGPHTVGAGSAPCEWCCVVVLPASSLLQDLVMSWR